MERQECRLYPVSACKKVIKAARPSPLQHLLLYPITMNYAVILAGGTGSMAENSGMVVFVPDTVPGDRVRAEITKVKKSYAFGRLVEVVEASGDRTEDVCPYAKEGCGGCPLGGIEYSAQAALKEKQVQSKLKRLAGVDEDFAFSPIAAAREPSCYRNKAVMPISTGGLITKKGGIQEPVHEPRIGFSRYCRLESFLDWCNSNIRSSLLTFIYIPR